jgi:hypothetical protein
MSLLSFIKAQLGLSSTPANNFVLDASANNGTMKLARGNAGATTQDVMTIDANGKVAFPQGKSAWNSGEVIQQKVFTDNGITVNSASYLRVTSAKSITPKSTNSKILIQSSFYIYNSTAAANYMNIKIVLNQATEVASPLSFGNGGGIQQYAMTSMFGVYDNTSLTAKEFDLYAAMSAGSIAGALSNLVITLTEIQN